MNENDATQTEPTHDPLLLQALDRLTRMEARTRGLERLIERAEGVAIASSEKETTTIPGNSFDPLDSCSYDTYDATAFRAQEIIELEATYPPPDSDAIRKDCRWFQEHV